MVTTDRRGIESALRRLPVPPMDIYRLVIVLGLLVTEAILGYVVFRFDRREFILAACLLLPIALLLYRGGRAEYLVLSILLTAGLVRISLSTGTESQVVASMLVSMIAVGIWVVGMMVVERRLRLKSVRTNVPLLGFIVVSAISLVWSYAFRDVLVITWYTFPLVQLASLVVMVLLPAVFLLVSNVIQDVRWLKVIWGVFLALGAVGIISQWLNLPTRRFVNTNGLFPLWIISLTYAQALFNRELRLWQRVGLALLCLLWLYRQLGGAIIWISGWAPALSAIVVTTFLRSKRLFIILVVLVVLWVGLRFDYFYDQVYVQSVEEGDMQRLDLWRTNLNHVINHPLFGSGPAGYAVYYMTYHPENARSTHNNYFDIVAQTGVVGFFFFLWFFVALARTGMEVCQRLQHSNGFEAALAYGLVGGVAGAVASMMLGDWIVPFAYNQTIMGFDHAVYAWVWMGALVSLYHILKARSEILASEGGDRQCCKS